MSRIAFVGLGNMGAPMAANLTRADHSLTGYDLSESARANGTALGLQIGSSAAAIAKEAEIVLTMLPAGRHVLSVWTELLPLAAPGALFIDCSTIDVESARSAHNVASEHGALSLDAPVSGGTAGATGARLTFMAGGSPEAFLKGRPVLEAMGKNIVHCGDAGAGQAAKICNNMILGISMIGVAEAFGLADRLGLSRQSLFDVASTSSGQCWALTSYCPVPGPVPASPANNAYRPGFAASLMLKDLRLAQEAAATTGTATPLGALSAQIYSLMSAQGLSEQDFSAVFAFLAGRRRETNTEAVGRTSSIAGDRT
jgi:3-hydroxyisobutyrate dehydrogenase